MKSANLLIFLMSIFCVKDKNVHSHNLLPVVLKFFDLREVTSINVILCNNSDVLATYYAARASYGQRPLSVSVTAAPNYDDLPSLFESQTHRIGVFFDLNCQSSWDLLHIVSEKLMMNTSYVHALVYDDTIELALHELELLNVQFDSDISVFTEHNEIYDLYRTAETRPVTAIRCGEWNQELEIIYLKPSRWDLDGVTIKATTVIKEFSFEQDGINKFTDHQYRPEIDTLSRYAIVIQNYLEKLCNFRTNLTITPDWGYFRHETGRFDPVSMFGFLEDGKVDLGLTLSRQFSSRLSVVFSTPSTRMFQTSVVFRHPAAGASYYGFARPFTLNTWLVTFLFIFFSSLVLKAIRNRNVRDQPHNESDYSYSLFSVIAVLSLQGSYVSSLRAPTRVLSGFLHFFGIMVYSYYGAEVVGFLLSPSPRTLTTVEKLVESPLDLWVENVSFHIDHFESVVGEKATKYYELAIKGPTRDKDKFLDRKKGLKRVQNGGFALYGVSSEMFQIIRNTFTAPEMCSLYVMDMLNLAVAVVIRKKSPYREIYYRALLRFLESGFRDYENKNWHAPKPVCFGSEDTAPVELEATLIAQLIFIMGSVLAVIFFIVERAIPPKRRQLVSKPTKNIKMRRLRSSHGGSPTLTWNFVSPIEL